MTVRADDEAHLHASIRINNVQHWVGCRQRLGRRRRLTIYLRSSMQRARQIWIMQSGSPQLMFPGSK
jgi:hypothetical protein